MILLLCIAIGLIILLVLAGPEKFTQESEVNPEDYGWTLQYPNSFYYCKGQYTLYKSSTDSWVLDHSPKNSPGVVDRIKRLTASEMEYINEFTDNIDNPTRYPSSYFR